MKKLLTVLFLSVVTVFSFSAVSCNNGEWKYDENSHWQESASGKKKNIQDSI